MSRQHIVVSKRRRLHEFLVDFHRRAFLVAKDVVSSQITLQVRSPGQIDERLLSNARSDSLYSGRNRRWEDVMHIHGDGRRVIAFHLLRLAKRSPELRDGGYVINILLLPLETVIDKCDFLFSIPGE